MLLAWQRRSQLWAENFHNKIGDIMAAKKPVKEVVVRVQRGIEFSCSKQLKMLRGSMTKTEFRKMILNEKQYVLGAKKRSQAVKVEE